METMMELVHALTESYNDSLSKTTDNKIESPILTVYSGKESAAQDETVTAAFRQVFLAARAGQLCRAVREKDGEESKIRPLGEQIDPESYVNRMFQCSATVFNNFQKLTVAAIYDSRDYETAEALLRDYEGDSAYFSGLFEAEGRTISVLRLILLDSGKEKSDFRAAVKKYLSDAKEENRTQATFLFSTTSLGGQMRSYEELYDLVGKLIAVGGSSSEEIRKRDVYGIFDRGSVRTVSYTKMERPNADISAMIAKCFVNCLHKYFNSQKLPAEKIMKQKLGLSEEGFAVTAEVYDGIREAFPDLRVLEYLPRIENPLGAREPRKLETMTFADFDRLTMSGFTPFFERYYLPVVREGATKEKIEDAVRRLLGRNFTLPEMMPLTADVMEKIKGWTKGSVRSTPPGQQVPGKIETLCKAEIDRFALEILPDMIEEKKKKAKDQKEEIVALEVDLRQNVIIEDPDVERYYGARVDAYLDRNLEDYLHEVLTEDSTKEAILSRLYEYAVRMIEGEPEFQLPFEGEIAARTGNRQGIFVTVHNSILGNTDGNIFYSAPVTPDPLFRVILMNRKDDNGDDTAAFTEMRQQFDTADDFFLDNGNANGITALQICSLSGMALM